VKQLKPRDVALAALKELSRGPGFVERYLDRAFQKTIQFSERDRAFTLNLVQGVLRWRLRLDWVIRQSVKFPFKKIEPTILDILRIALYQILFMERVPESAAVNEAVKQTKVMGKTHLTSFVNGTLRQICRNKDLFAFPHKEKGITAYLSVLYSFPEWLVTKWAGELGYDLTERLLEASKRVPGLVVRTNTLKIDRKSLIGLLELNGIKCVPTRYVPHGIEIKGLKGPINRLELFREGLFQVQGEAAQVCSYLIRPVAGESVLDLCAGLGGKTTHVAELMANKGMIVALDINRHRLISLLNSSRRLSVNCISPVVADATGSALSMIGHRFDKIMVDPPCSALGTISRHPDGKWTRDESDINRLAYQQGRMLDNAVQLLRRGGRMLYTTCTISRQENEAVIYTFLERNKGVVLEDLRLHVPKWGLDLIDDSGFFRSFPHLHSMDGFFGALLKKKD